MTLLIWQAAGEISALFSELFLTDEWIGIPCSLEVRFEPQLAITDPWSVMVLGSLNISVSKQYRNILDRYTCQQQLDAEGIPEPMSVPPSHGCEVEEFLQSTLPSTNRCMKLRCSCPKEIIFAQPGNCR